MASDDVAVQKVKDKIADLKSKYGEKTPKQNIDFNLTDDQVGNTFYRARFRVTLNDKQTEKNDLTEQMEKELDKSASWWKVEYREIFHGDSQSGNCPINPEHENSNGSVPEGV